MQQALLTLALFLSTTELGAATCPAFKPEYHKCHSRSMIESFQVSAIEVSERTPHYRFLIRTKFDSKDLKFVADGQLEEITVQDVTYGQIAYCRDKKLHLIIRNDQSFGKESYEFSPEGGGLKMRTYLNSVLINEVLCSATE